MWGVGRACGCGGWEEPVGVCDVCEEPQTYYTFICPGRHYHSLTIHPPHVCRCAPSLQMPPPVCPRTRGAPSWVWQRR